MRYTCDLCGLVSVCVHDLDMVLCANCTAENSNTINSVLTDPEINIYARSDNGVGPTLEYLDLNATDTRIWDTGKRKIADLLGIKHPSSW